jgi:hypothetical protein
MLKKIFYFEIGWYGNCWLKFLKDYAPFSRRCLPQAILKGERLKKGE